MWDVGMWHKGCMHVTSCIHICGVDMIFASFSFVHSVVDSILVRFPSALFMLQNIDSSRGEMT
jgi:hypothetical protein